MSVVALAGLSAFYMLGRGMISVTDIFQNFDCTLYDFVI